jgi:hypothetical protein
MKKLFFALALTGIVGAASVNTVSAMTHSKIVVAGGGDEKKKKKKCDKDKASCKGEGTASSDGKCAAGEKKCCHAGAKSTDAKTAAPDKSDTKKVEEQK